MKSTLKIGDSIVNKKPYKGEGEFIIADITEFGVKCIKALCDKHPNLNGQEFDLSNYELQYYEKI